MQLNPAFNCAALKKDLCELLLNYCKTQLYWFIWDRLLTKTDYEKLITAENIDSCRRGNCFKSVRSCPPGYIAEIAQLTAFTIVTSLEGATGREHTVLIFQYTPWLICSNGFDVLSKLCLRYFLHTLLIWRRPGANPRISWLLKRLYWQFNVFEESITTGLFISICSPAWKRLQTVRNVSMTTGLGAPRSR